MKIITKLSLRYLKENKRKVIVIILNIILSTMLLFTVSLGASTLRGHSVNSSINEYGSHHLIFKNLDSKIYENLINDKKIKDVVVIQNSNLTFNEVSFNLISFNKNIDKYISLESGKYPEHNNEIIISNKNNYKINDTINEFKIVGIYNNAKESLNFDDYSIITKDNIKNDFTANYLVTFKSSISLYKEIYRKADEFGLKYTLNSFGDRVYDKVDENVWLLQSLGQYPDTKTQIGMYSMLLVILLVISMFSVMTIKNSFEISLSERKKYFGTLRSIGASKKQIFKMVLFETLLLSLISIPIGLLFGYGFTYFLVNIINNMMQEINTIEYNIIIYPVYMVIAFIFIVTTIIWSAIKPAKKSSKISPIEVIKENKIYYFQKSQENYPFIKRTLGTEGELAYKTIKRNGIKSTVIVNSLIVSIILFITLSAFVNFLRGNWSSEIDSNYDITIYTSNVDNDYQAIDEIKNINEIDEINISKGIVLNFKKNNMKLTDKAIKHYEKNRYSNIDLLGIDKEQYNKIQEQIGLKEDIPILYNYGTYFENDKYNQVKWFKDNIDVIEICSIIDDYQNNIIYNKNCYYTFDEFHLLNEELIGIDRSGPYLIVSIEWLDEFAENYIKLYENEFKYEDSKRITIGINTDKYIEVDRKLNNIFDKYSELELSNGYHNYKLDNYEEYITLSTIELVINIIMTFIIIISLTSIINTINTNLLLRETEFSILRSIGLSKKGLNKMLLFESVFLCIKTIILGIPLATMFVGLLMYLSNIMTGDIFVFPTNAYIITIVATFIVIFIMNLYSSNFIKNKNIIDSVRKNSI